MTMMRGWSTTHRQWVTVRSVPGGFEGRIGNRQHMLTGIWSTAVDWFSRNSKYGSSYQGKRMISYKRVSVDEKIKRGEILWANAKIEGTQMEQDTYLPCEVSSVTLEDGNWEDDRRIVCIEARPLHSRDCIFFHSSKDFKLSPALFRKEVG